MTERTSGKENDMGYMKRWDGIWRTEDSYQSSISSDLDPTSIPVRNGDRVTGELSRGNELPNVFLERSRWLEPLHENILQAGQYFCPNNFLQGSHDTWRKVLGYIEILYRGKWE